MLEAAGVPTITTVTKPFEVLARLVAKGVLVPNLPLLVIPDKSSYDDRMNVLDWLGDNISVVERALAEDPTPATVAS